MQKIFAIATFYPNKVKRERCVSERKEREREKVCVCVCVCVCVREREIKELCKRNFSAWCGTPFK